MIINKRANISKIQSRYRLCTFTKTNSKWWIIDLNAKCETIKLLENHRENADDLQHGDDLLDTTLKAQSMKERIDAKRMRRPTIDWEEIF